jgi:ABC-type Zn uptake system ZnuABC Zn-binding protein ZnuA
VINRGQTPTKQHRGLTPGRVGEGVTLLLALLFSSSVAFASPLRVVTTTADLHSLVLAVGGDAVSASFLIPAGQDAESFQPRPQDLEKLRTAQVVVRVGLDYDLWLDRTLREIRPLAVIDASTDVALLDVRGGGIGPGDGHAHGRGNPHYWLDPLNAGMITATLLEAFARVDPANAKLYEANRLCFLARLEKLVPEWSRALRSSGTLIAYHDTWPYFARRFRLHIVGIIETRPGVAPSPSHLATLSRLKIAAILREPHEPRRDADFLAARTGAKVVILASSVGAVPEARDYLSLIDYNVRALSR